MFLYIICITSAPYLLSLTLCFCYSLKAVFSVLGFFSLEVSVLLGIHVNLILMALQVPRLGACGAVLVSVEPALPKQELCQLCRTLHTWGSSASRAAENNNNNLVPFAPLAPYLKLKREGIKAKLLT